MSTIIVNGNTYVWPDQFTGYQYLVTWPLLVNDTITDMATKVNTAAGSVTSASSQAAIAVTASSSAAASAATALTASSSAAASAAAALVSSTSAAASAASIVGGPVASVNGLTGVVSLYKNSQRSATWYS